MNHTFCLLRLQEQTGITVIFFYNSVIIVYNEREIMEKTENHYGKQIPAV